MARQFRLAWKIILVASVMLVIGFLAGYNSETRHQIKSNKSSATNNVYPEVPHGELWDIIKNASPAEQKHFESNLKNTKVIVIRSWIKDAYPPLYRVISRKTEIEEIVQSTHIKYVREKQPMHVSYQLFFLSETGAYMMIYERGPKGGGGSVMDLIPVTVKYDSYGRLYHYSYNMISLERLKPDFQYIQAYPSPEFQRLVDKYTDCEI